jgi:hypothetical protein
MDGPDLIQSEREKIAGHLQWTDSGAMVEITETSLAFEETASLATIRQMEGTERESRTWRAHHA